MDSGAKKTMGATEVLPGVRGGQRISKYPRKLRRRHSFPWFWTWQLSAWMFQQMAEMRRILQYQDKTRTRQRRPTWFFFSRAARIITAATCSNEPAFPHY